MGNWEGFLGNEPLKARLRAMIERRTLPHAWILLGPRGSGRRTLARLIAASLLCEHAGSAAAPCGACEACRRIREGIHPDFETVLPEEGKSSISVKQIREMRASMSLSAVESDCRVFLIEEADKMSAAAQNALLISLEEPPNGVFLFLISENEEALLPTVRSRAQAVRTELFEVEQLREYLRGNARFSSLERQSPKKAAALLEGAHGTVGTALELLKADKLSRVVSERETVDGILAALATPGASAFYEATRPLGSLKREELASVLSLLGEALRDLILLKRDSSISLLYYTEREVASEMSDRLGIRSLLSLADAVEEVLEDLAHSANVTVATTVLLKAATSR